MILVGKIINDSSILSSERDAWVSCLPMDYWPFGTFISGFPKSISMAPFYLIEQHFFILVAQLESHGCVSANIFLPGNKGHIFIWTKVDSPSWGIVSIWDTGNAETGFSVVKVKNLVFENHPLQNFFQESINDPLDSPFGIFLPGPPWAVFLPGWFKDWDYFFKE